MATLGPEIGYLIFGNIKNYKQSRKEKAGHVLPMRVLNRKVS